VISDTQGSIIGDLQEERNHFKQKSESAERVLETQKLYIEKLKSHMGVLELRMMVAGVEVPPRPQLD
jgi:hemerythrin-like domain-containing protein